MLQINWALNPTAERVISSETITFKTVTVRLDDLDFDLSLHNQARKNAMNQEVRDRYANGMRTGDHFPMCVCAPIPPKEKSTKKFLFLDGNHRGGAAKDVGATEIKAYMVNPNSGSFDEVYGSLPRILNETNGLPLSIEESIAHAIHDITIKVRTVEDAAKKYKLTEDTLRLLLRASKVKIALEENGIHVPPDMKNRTTLAPLTSISMDSVMIAAGRVAINAMMKKTQIEEMVRDVKKAKSEAAQLAVIRDLEQNLSLGLHKPKTSIERVNHKTRIRLMTWITTGERIWKGKTKLSQFDVKDVENTTRRLRQLEKCIHGVTCP